MPPPYAIRRLPFDRDSGTAHGEAVASTACRISLVAASGWDRNETCEAGTSTIVALARSAMNRCVAGGIALSSVPSRYQHGSVFQAGGPDDAPSAAPFHGRCAAAMTSAVARSTSAAKVGWNASESK